ncbi:MAG: hypothetical protein CMH83_12625 [Nocardioides sp.]|nr:hypothetical protein [Nocardioides sp.]
MLVAAALVVATGVGVLLGSSPSRSDPLDPGNPGGDGAQAVARVLADAGVDIDVVRSADALDERLPEVAGRTEGLVVVTATERLGETTTRRLLDAAGNRTLVLVDPPPLLLDDLGVDGAGSLPAGRAVAAGCSGTVPPLDDLRIEVDTARTVTADRGTSCFDGALLLDTGSRGTLVVLTAGDVLTNDQVLRADNAAVALRLLGQQDELVWYVPSYDDLVADDGVGARSLLPAWLLPALLLLALAVPVAMVWRGRRLGPLAVEPLPVVVRALETTLSRGRLYRRAGDRAHTTRVLRADTRRAAADHLHLGRGVTADTVVRAVATRTGRDPDEVAALLHPDAPPPTDDRGLVALARSLADLEREVRQP